MKEDSGDDEPKGSLEEALEQEIPKLDPPVRKKKNEKKKKKPT